jgi:hypothetical protein
MAIDPERAAFIKQAFRFVIAKDATILGADNSARSIEVEANVDEATATALATTILAQNEDGRLYEVVIQGLLTLDNFLDGVPRYIPDIPELNTDGRTCRVISFECDLETGLTTARVFG